MEFNNLPKDIIFDIFSRIPLKTLYKLRCVCKKWHILLQLCHEFTSFYHKKHKTSPILLFKKHNIETQTTELTSYYIDCTKTHHFSPNFPQIFTSILTCNGILCLISSFDVRLYDPIIKRVSILPNSAHFSSTFSWAFGFSSTRAEFKLLHFYSVSTFDKFHYCSIKEVMCEIITCPSSQLGLVSEESHHSWRFLGKCPWNILGRKNFTRVRLKMYWFIEEKIFNPECVKIMSFDLETEIFNMVIFPRKYSNRSIECLNLLEIKGKLCLTDRLPWESTMNVWMMVKEDEGFLNLWVKKYEIDLVGVFHHDVRILGHLSNFNNDDDNDDDDGEILMRIGDKSFGMYELRSKEYREMGGEMDTIQQGWNLQLMIDRKFLL